MTRTPRHHRSTAARARHLLSAAAVAAIAIVGLSSTDADAGPRTSSTVIADEAAQAVAALGSWELTQDPVDYVRFVQHRDTTASMAEAEIDLAPGALHDAWANVSLSKQQVLLGAISQLGVPYRNLASKPGVGFDCSGLTIWAFGQAGIEIPRISRDQIRAAESVEREDAEAGDLVYYPGHISMYLGADTMIHSPNSGHLVEITDLPNRSLRFGDAVAAQRVEPAAPTSLVDGAVTVAK